MDKTKPKKLGRASKYKEEYCDLLIEHMKKGLSFDSFAGIVKVNLDTLYEWGKVHKEFSEAKKLAFEENRIYWEEIGIAGMVGKIPGFNATIWIFNMKNRFKWRDNHHIEQNSNVTIQDANSEIAPLLLAQLKKLNEYKSKG